LRSALCGRELDETLTLSPELRSFAEWMDALDLERVRDFCQALREQARMLGTALPIIAQEGFPPSSR
jgi:hypothetical protein